MALLRNKPARALIIIMTALVFAGILIAKIYYSGLNQSVDPRVKPARELYGKYNKLAWEDNLSAENNLNRLLGLPLRERNLIHKLFPRERLKSENSRTKN